MKPGIEKFFAPKNSIMGDIGGEIRLFSFETWKGHELIFLCHSVVISSNILVNIIFMGKYVIISLLNYLDFQIINKLHENKSWIIKLLNFLNFQTFDIF